MHLDPVDQQCLGNRTGRRVFGRRRLLASLALVGLLAACGSNGLSSTDPTAVATRGTVVPGGTGGSVATTGELGTSGTTGGGGWIDGEPEWTGSDSDSAASGGSGDDHMTASAEPAASPSDEESSGAVPATTPKMPSVADVAGDVAAPQPPDNSPLRAGSVDDNADFAAFLQYLARIEELGITTRPFDPAGRIVVSVQRSDGSPAAGIEISATGVDGVVVASLRTTADGTARFLPALYGATQETYTFTVGAGSVTTGPDSAATLVLDAAEISEATAPVAVDVLFLLDATGSMGDEIDRLKTTIDSVAGRIAALETEPDVRFGMTLYRDLADSFVTTTYDFTDDIDGFRKALSDVVAEGGDDYPEALDEGLAEALGAPTWRDPASTVQLVFLVADAPPQVGRQVDVTYVQSIVDAIGRGIKVFPIASSESDDQAEAVFRQLAAATGARFVFLSSGAGGAATGRSTDIDSTDYEELALDDLIVRLVKEELSALGGIDVEITTPPTEPTTPPTNPQGQ